MTAQEQPAVDDEPDAGNYDYPYDDDDLTDDGNFPFECAAYWTGGRWHCPLAGTEDCDWECTETFGDDDAHPSPPTADEGGEG